MTLKYESEILLDLMKRDGDVTPSDVLPYESELKEKYLNQVVGAYPKLQDYHPEWLNYNLYYHLPSEFPIESVTNVTIASFHDVVPYAYETAILKGQTLVNLIKDNTEDEVLITEGHKDLELLYTLKNSTQYTLLMNVVSANDDNTSNWWCGIMKTEDWGSESKRYVKGINKLLFTTREESDCYAVRIRGLGSTIKDVMLLEGDYTNVDIPYFEGMQSVKMPVLTTTGKNLFDKEKFIDKNQWSADSNGPYRSISLQLEPNTVYTMTRGSASCTGFGLYVNVSNHRNSSSGAHWWLFHHTVNYSINISFTTNETGIIYFNSGTVDLLKDYKDLLNEVQLEKGNTTTSYEPYKSNILTVNEPVELGSVCNVQDELNVLTGEVVKATTKIKLDSTLGWIVSKDYSGGKISFISSNEIYGKNQNDGIVSDKFPTNGNGDSVSLSKTSGRLVITVLTSKISNWNDSDTNDEKVRKFGIYLDSLDAHARYINSEKVVKTVDLSCINEQGESATFRPIEGTMHVNTSSQALPPLLDMSVPVEATTQNLMSFANIEEEE